MTSEPQPTLTSVHGREVRPMLVLAVVLTAAFVQLVDVSITNVAVPSIRTDLDASFSAVQLVQSGYQLAFACTLITAARLGDLHGRRRLFLIGMVGFTLASILCGFATSPTMLVLSRVLQGLMSGLMYPQVLSVIQVVFPPRERPRAFAVLGATIGLATILGPLLGGALIQWNVVGSQWRSIFLVNVPIGVAAVIAAIRLLPESRAPKATRLDVPGALLSALALLLLILPLTEGRERGWPWWLIAMLVASVPTAVAFVLVERRRTHDDDSPLVDLRILDLRGPRIGMPLSAVFFAGIPAFFFTFSLYVQVGEGFTALRSGLTTIPFAFASAVLSSRSPVLARRLGRTVLLIGRRNGRRAADRHARGRRAAAVAVHPGVRAGWCGPRLLRRAQHLGHPGRRPAALRRAGQRAARHQPAGRGCRGRGPGRHRVLRRAVVLGGRSRTRPGAGAAHPAQRCRAAGRSGRPRRPGLRAVLRRPVGVDRPDPERVAAVVPGAGG